MKKKIIKVLILGLISFMTLAAQKFCEHENLKCHNDKQCCHGLICHNGKCT